MDARIVKCSRDTKETKITVTLNLDGTGKAKIQSGIGFFDHMLEGFARHGLFDLDVSVQGDLNVDSHHTIEDTGIVLGQAIAKALGDKKKNLRTFFILSILLAIANGLYGVVYAVHETAMNSVFSNLDKDALATAINQQKQMLIIYPFAGAAIIAAVRLIVAEKKKVHLTFVQNKKSLLYIILAAVVSAFAVNVLVALVGIVDTTLLYTFDNAGVMLLSALASALIFKDKLSTKNIIGCVIMTLALVLMGASGTLADALAPMFGMA